MRKLGILLFVLTMSFGALLAGGPAYVGGSIGNSSVEVEDSGVSFDASDTAFKVYGGYRFFKFFGVEGSYVDFGSPEDSGFTIEPDGWDAFAVGVLPIGERFEVFGKLGLLWWDADISGSGFSDSDSGSDTAWGVGGAFKIGDHFAVRLEYEVFDIEDTEDVNLFSVGGEWRF
jgi:OOP family OmpA-OmpF porin